MKKIKETSDGIYEWIKTENGGFWSRLENLTDIQDRVPFSCPACSKLMMNIDDASFYRFGVCITCEIDWVEGREIPNEIRTNRKSLTRWIKEKIEENKNNPLSKTEE